MAPPQTAHRPATLLALKTLSNLGAASCSRLEAHYALGGVWQIVVHGFGGVRLKDGVLSISPRLPDTWRQMRFQVWFRGALIELTQSKGEVEVFISRGRREVDLEIYGNRYSLQKGQRVYAKEG